MPTISSDLLSPMNGASAVSPGTSSGLTENSPEAIQNRFLKLLTVQMKNQDPTKPMDNAELTTQLAQLPVLKHAHMAGKGALLQLFPILNKFLGSAAWVFVCFQFCFVVWHLFLRWDSSFMLLLNWNLRGRVEHCSIYQITIFNSQPPFKNIPTDQRTI